MSTSSDARTRPIRVRILGRDYPLRIRPQDEALTRDMAAYVDGKLRTFKDAHPEQSDVTAAVVIALALAEELYSAWEAQDAAAAARETAEAALEEALTALDVRLAGVLAPSDEVAGASEQDGDNPV